MIARWAWVTLSSVAVLAGVGTLLLHLADRAEPRPPAMEASPDAVREEIHYYVLLSAIEVEPRNGNGNGWDPGGSAPDIRYEIRWQGHAVFESSVKSDTLLAKWSNVEIGVGDLASGVSLDDSIKAARITVRPGEEIEFRVYDRDVVDDDLIGAWTVLADALRVGEQRWERPAGSLVSVTCRVLPMDEVAFEALTK